MKPKQSTSTSEDDIYAEELQPLNAMVAENLKKAIIRKIYRDVEKNVPAGSDAYSPAFRQYLLAIGTSWAGLSSGMTAGFSAVLLPQLKAPDSYLPITPSEASWIASMAALPMMLGCLCSGFPMDRFGRKPAVIASCVIFSLGWVILGFSSNVTGLYIGRFITGLSLGLIAPMCQVYIAEASDPKNRGILLSGAPLAVAIGIFLSHLLGTFLHWSTTAFLCGVPPVISVLFCLIIPESPIWLLGCDKLVEANDSYEWFHGNSPKSKEEWGHIVANVKISSSSSPQNVSRLKLIQRAAFLKPLFVLMLFFFIQQFSGVNAIAFYSVTIVKNIIPKINEYLVTNIIDLVRFIVSVIGVVLLKKFGRRTLGIVSAFGSGLSLFSLSTYLFLMGESDANGSNKINVTDNIELMNNLNETDAQNLHAEEGLTPLHCVPLISLLCYICFVSIGLVPIPWILTGELFSKQVRGIGSGVTSSFGFICYFVVVKATPDMFEGLTRAGTFSLFGAICVLGGILLSLCLVETKDKTLLEIEAHYEGQNLKVKNIEMSEAQRY